MEVRRSRHGKAALVIVGNNFIKFVTLNGNGPIFESMALKDFRAEFNKVLDLTVEQAALSFFRSAKAAFRHNAEVIKFLLGEILMANLSEMTLAEITLRYNNLCVAAGKKPRKTFDSKKLALEALEKLDAEVMVATPVQEAALKSTKSRSNRMTENTEGKEVKVRGKGIGARAMELLLEGKGTQEVIDTIKAEIPDASPTPATIAWYKNKLRQDGKLAKPVKKEKVAKAPKAVPVEDAADESDEGEGE